MISETALKFVGCINAHDLKCLTSLMTGDHVFIDSLGERSGRPAIETGWRQYFDMVPDYWIRIDRVIIEGDTVVLAGAAGGTFVPGGGRPRPGNRWETPAMWMARIEGRRVAEWRIYADNEPIRAKMRKAGKQS